jgi:hypothetical protein
MKADVAGFSNLLPDTAQVLQSLAAMPLLERYSFVGGSALAVYLGHRKSEDIDLFTWDKELPPLEIAQDLQRLGFDSIQIIDLSPQQTDFVIDGVKVTFFANGWDILKNRANILQHLYVADMETLTAMKVNTLFLRAKYRDYYDLYCISKQCFSLEQIFQMASSNMSNLSKTLFQRALIFVDDIIDEDVRHLEIKEKVTVQKIAQHFQKEIVKWNKRTQGK